MSPQDMLLLATLVGAVFIGTALQRVTGVGFALVAAPFLVAVLGPFNGILVVNLFGTITSFMVFTRVFRQVEYSRLLWLLIPALIAILPGAWVAVHMRADILSVAIGALIVLALSGSRLLQRSRTMSGRAGAVIGGFVSGFMNVTAGVGGPAVTAYALASRWPQPAFAATVQLYFCVLGASSMAAKGSLPMLDAFQWFGCGVSLVLGILAGELLSKHLSPEITRRAVIFLAYAGAVFILVKGGLGWAAG